MSFTSTVFCTASTRFCIIAPTPRPISAIPMEMNQIGVVWSMLPSTARPAVRATAPPTRNRLKRPVRLTS